MNRTIRFPASLALSLALLSAGHAASFFADDFDSYGLGSNMHGQGGWKGCDNNPAAGALVSNAQANSLPHSVDINGNSDLVHEFNITSGQWSLSIDQFIPSTSVGLSYLILVDVYQDGGPYEWSVQNALDLDSGVVRSDGTFATASLITDSWVNWTFTIDLDANTVNEYYNHSLFSSSPWDSGWSGDGVAEGLAAVDLYANLAGPVFYDNFRLEQVPEPHEYALMAGMGLLGFAAWRRRRG